MLYWRGRGESKEVMLEVNSDGKVQVNEDEQLKKHFREETQHMAREVWGGNGGDDKWRSHLVIEKGKRTLYQTTKDFS